MKAIGDVMPMFVAQPPKQGHCAKHGEFVSRHLFGRIWSQCPVCAEEHDVAEKAAQEAHKRESKLRAWQGKLGDSGIPERFHSRTLATFEATTPEQAKALAFAHRYVDGFADVLKTGRCAVFLGRPGTGKTHLAAGIGLRLMGRDHRTVLFTTVMRAIRRVKDTWSRDSRMSESEAIASMVTPDLLILDEVGVQFGSETEKLILFDVLNERYEKRRPTLILSNLSLPDVKQFLGERIYDRLREDGGEVLVFDWESHRGRVGGAA